MLISVANSILYEIIKLLHGSNMPVLQYFFTKFCSCTNFGVLFPTVDGFSILCLCSAYDQLNWFGCWVWRRVHVNVILRKQGRSIFRVRLISSLRTELRLVQTDATCWMNIIQRPTLLRTTYVFHSNFSSNIVQHLAKNKKSVIASSEICTQLIQLRLSFQNRKL